MILLVGEGDFSFTVSFLQQMKLHQEVFTTSLLSEDEVYKLHRNADENVRKIKNLGANVIFNVDATELHLKEEIKLQGKFNIVIFNFPHVGGKSNIKKNRDLLKSFFLSAEQVLAKDGQIRVTLAKGQGGTPADKPVREWQNSWQIVSMAAYPNLILHKTEEFSTQNFPEYSSSGFRSQDKHFHTEGAVVHVFERTSDTDNTINNSIAKLCLQDCQKYHFGKYVMDRISRVSEALTQEPHHPFSIIKMRMQAIALEIFGCNTRLVDNLPRIIYKCDLSIPHFCGYPAESHTKDIEECFSNPVNAESADIGECSNNPVNTKGVGYLRTTLLENEFLEDSAELSDVKWFLGDVYKPCAINETARPVDIEIMAVDYTDSCSDFEKNCEQFLKEILCGENAHVRSPTDTKLLDHNGWLDIKWIATSKESLNVDCNELNQIILAQYGWTKSEPRTSVFILSMLSLAQVLYNIGDPRILWTRDCRYYKQFSNFPQSLDSQPYSLYPPTWTFDLSFWKRDIFDEQTFLNVCRDTCGDSLLSVKLIDTFREEKSGRSSNCYRLVFHSCDQALSYATAHDLDGLLRIAIAKRLSFEPR